MEEFERLRRENPFFRDADSVSSIEKGYSGDRKYIVFKGEQKYLLRCYRLEEHAGKSDEYDALRQMQKLDVLCSRPLLNGTLPEAGIGYMLLTYIEGTDAAEELPSYPMEVQYRIGREAGAELLKIHRYRAPSTVSPWEDRKRLKHMKYSEEYRKQDVKLPNEARILSFIDDHLSLLKGRPNVFQHDDFHLSNLIVKDRRLSGVIDFNRFDWGDPVHEFLKIGMFSSEISLPFSMGQIQGYHGNSRPDERFWRLYSLYAAMTLISSVVWIRKTKPEETGNMMAILDRVLEDHRGFESIVPAWYSAEYPQMNIT